MRVNETCKKLCTVEMNAEDIDLFVKRIDEDYNANWMVDNLPAATVGLLVGGAPLYARGIPIGGIEEGGRYFIYNHHKLVVRASSARARARAHGGGGAPDARAA